MRLKYMFTFWVLCGFKANPIENKGNFTEFGGIWIQNDDKILSNIVIISIESIASRKNKES